jgi:thioredoxin reductase (NADPH)
MIHDLLVVGLGPAGCSAMFAAMSEGMSVMAVEEDRVGGLVRAARWMGNLPDHPRGITGLDYAARLRRRLVQMDAPFVRARVERLRRGPSGFVLHLDSGEELRGRTVCLAVGTAPRPLPFPVAGGCAVVRDVRALPLELEGRTVAVVGGGDVALDTALSAIDRGARVLLVMRGERPRCASHLLCEAAPTPIEPVRQAEVLAVTAETGAAGPGRTVLHLRRESGVEQLAVDYLAVCIGRQPRRELLDQHLPGWTPGEQPDTPIPGLFLAGDLIHPRERRFVPQAEQDGARAAALARDHVRRFSG